MPNWCSNTVLVQGDPDDIAKLIEHVDGEHGPFTLNKIIVMPQQLKGQSSPEKDEDVAARNIELYGAKDWYDWSNKAWGTKWDVNAQIVSDTTSPMNPGYRTVKFQFDSAWAPPFPVYKVLAKQFPNTNIYITYDEPGCDFAGWQLFHNGELHSEKETESVANMVYYMEASDDLLESLLN